MTGVPTEFDTEGNWTGTCEDCGTNHEGWPPDTLGGRMRCLRARAQQTGAVHVEAQLDQLEATISDRRDAAVRSYFES